MALPEVTLAEKAYHLILDQILRGTLSVGITVSRVKLAEQFVMSLVPVGGALKRLEFEGLVKSRRRAGIRVRVPTAEEIREVHEVRKALECQTARPCAERMTFQEVLELKRLAEDLDALFATAASKESDKDFLYAVGKYHIALHMKIAECARFKSLRSAIEKSHVLVFRWIYDRASGNEVSPSNSHQELVAHIVEESPQEAEDAMRAHVQQSLETVKRGINQLQAGSWRLKRPRRVRPEIKESCASRDGVSARSRS